MTLSTPSRARLTTPPAGSPAGARISAASRRSGPGRHRAGFWLVALAFLTAMAFSTAPTPLYPLYQARDGFSTFTVTIVFAVYAIGVVISLLLAGHISDRVGRKKILIPALTLELVAAALFLTDTSLPVLLVARLLTGLGVGMITATATAHLHELHTARPGSAPRRFELVSTAANIGGLGVGPLIAGLVAQYVDAPLRTPYTVFAVLLLASVVAVAMAPETVDEQPIRPTYRPHRISLGHGDPAGYLAALAAGFASFAVSGLLTSVAPGFVANALHHPSRALAGSVLFAVFGGAAGMLALTNRLTARTTMPLGLLSQAVGILTLVLGMHTANLATFLLGGVAAGVGASLLFRASVGTVVAVAAPAKRSEALAGLFIISYLGLGLPAVGFGIAARTIAAITAMTWCAAVLLVMLIGVILLVRRSHSSR